VPLDVSGELPTENQDGIVSPTLDKPPPAPGQVIHVTVPDDQLGQKVPLPGTANRVNAPLAPPTIRSPALVIGLFSGAIVPKLGQVPGAPLIAVWK
jgi:hypothetical protein